MLSKPVTCEGCPLEKLGSGFSTPDGTGHNGILLLGEALGGQEALTGLPFQGQAGAMLSRILGRTRLRRQDFKIWNCIACRPPNNYLVGAPYEEMALDHCRQYFHGVLKKMKPKVIVPMGNVALRTTTGLYGIEDKRGYVYDQVYPQLNVLPELVREAELGKAYIVPTVHPSYVMQGNQKWIGVVARDLTRAIDVSFHGYSEPPCTYVQYPDTHAIEKFIAEARAAVSAGAWMTADIETPYSHATTEDEYGEITDTEILRISFAFNAYHAITIPWHNHFIHLIQELLNIPTPYMCFWNADFDVPRIKSKGLTIRPKILDSMYMWHFLQSDLPKGLGFVSTFYTDLKEWKSKSDEFPEFYSCRDADAQIQCTYGIRDNLKRQNRFQRFLSDHTELHPILTDMGRSGVMIDVKKRDDFKKAIENEKEVLDERIQSAVPYELRPFKPRRKIPSEAALGEPVKVGDGSAGFWDFDRNTGEWGIRHKFLCNSSDQVKKYIKFRNHPVPRNHKTGRDTTGKVDLASLARKYPKDPFYRLVVESRENTKILGQYINGYEPDPDGCVRTLFTQKPSTWRLASEKPNVQNIRKRWNLAKQYRQQFVARNGHVLVELDYRAIEAVLVGYYANDPEYVMAAKMGVHAILAGYVLDHELKRLWETYASASHVARMALEASGVTSNTLIQKAVKDIKKNHSKEYDDCKHVVHGSNYGGTPFKMKVEFPDSFPSVSHAKQMQDLYFRTIAKKVKKWQTATLMKATSLCYLDSDFGYRHHFYDVGYWNPRNNEFVMGTDAKRALAFLPQNTAAAVIKSAIRRIAEKAFYRKALRWMIHDSLILELPLDKLLGDRIRWVASVMQSPIPELGGLSIDVEVAVGRNWGEMEDFVL